MEQYIRPCRCCGKPVDKKGIISEYSPLEEKYRALYICSECGNDAEGGHVDGKEEAIKDLITKWNQRADDKYIKRLQQKIRKLKKCIDNKSTAPMEV